MIFRHELCDLKVRGFIDSGNQRINTTIGSQVLSTSQQVSERFSVKCNVHDGPGTTEQDGFNKSLLMFRNTIELSILNRVKTESSRFFFAI